MSNALVIQDLGGAKQLFQNAVSQVFSSSGGFIKADLNNVASFLAHTQGYSGQKQKDFILHCSLFGDALMALEVSNKDGSKRKIAPDLDPYNIFATMVKTFEAGLDLNPIRKECGLGTFWNTDKKRYDLQFFVMYEHLIRKANEQGYMIETQEISTADEFSLHEDNGITKYSFKPNLDVPHTWDNLKGIMVRIYHRPTKIWLPAKFINRADIDAFRRKNKGADDKLNFFWANNPIKMAKIKAVRVALFGKLSGVAEFEGTHTYTQSGIIEQVETEIAPDIEEQEKTCPSEVFASALHWDKRFTPNDVPAILYDALIMALHAYDAQKKDFTAEQGKRITDKIAAERDDFIKQNAEHFPNGFDRDAYMSYRQSQTENKL